MSNQYHVLILLFMMSLESDKFLFLFVNSNQHSTNKINLQYTFI